MFVPLINNVVANLLICVFPSGNTLGRVWLPAYGRTRLPGCSVSVFGSLLFSLAWLFPCKRTPGARLRSYARIGRFSSAWLAPCSRVLARSAIPCAGRWREVSRVTSLFPAIHRLYISPFPLPPCLLVAPRLRRRFLGFVVFSLSAFALGRFVPC